MGTVSGWTVEQGVGEAWETIFDQPPQAPVKNMSDSSGSSAAARPGEASGPSMRPGLPVVTGRTKTMAQPRLRTQSSTSAADAFSGLGPENLHNGADGCTPSGGQLLPSQHSPTHGAPLSQNTPSAKLQVLTTKTARARGTVLGGAVEQEAADTSEEEGPQPSYNTSPDQPAQGTVMNRPGEAPGPLRRPGFPLQHHGTVQAPGPKRDNTNGRLPTARAGGATHAGRWQSPLRWAPPNLPAQSYT